MWEELIYYVEETILYYITVVVAGIAVVVVAYCCCRDRSPTDDDELAPPLKLTLDQHYRLMLAEASTKTATSGSPDNFAHLLLESEPEPSPSPSRSVRDFQYLMPSAPICENHVDSVAQSSPVTTIQCEPGPWEDTHESHT